MFERFTDRARATVVHAQDEARRLRHNYIGTEHLLLGLLREGEGVAAEVLTGLGVPLDAARHQVEEIIGQGEQPPSGHIPFTPRAKKALELSLREARQLRHHHIGTEHILLGLVREGEGVACQVLVGLGAGLDQTRQRVTDLLQVRSGEGAARPSAPPAAPPLRRRTPAAEQIVTAAERLAGTAPVGSHHLLEALARSDDSAAAQALATLGVDVDALTATIDGIALEGTADLTDEDAAARRMVIRLVSDPAGDEVQLVLRDEQLTGLVRELTGQLGGPVRGDDPVVGGLVDLHRTVHTFLTGLLARLAPPAEPDAPGGSAGSGGIPGLVHRAIHSRLRRRGR